MNSLHPQIRHSNQAECSDTASPSFGSFPQPVDRQVQSCYRNSRSSNIDAENKYLRGRVRHLSSLVTALKEERRRDKKDLNKMSAEISTLKVELEREEQDFNWLSKRAKREREENREQGAEIRSLEKVIESQALKIQELRQPRPVSNARTCSEERPRKKIKVQEERTEV